MVVGVVQICVEVDHGKLDEVLSMSDAARSCCNSPCKPMHVLIVVGMQQGMLAMHAETCNAAVTRQIRVDGWVKVPILDFCKKKDMASQIS